MHNLYISPLVFKVFGDKTAVTVMWLLLAAQQAAIVEHLPWRRILDAAGAHEIEKLAFVYGPVTLLFLVGVKHLLRRGKTRKMDILYVADRFGEVAKIVFLRKSRKLRD